MTPLRQSFVLAIGKRLHDLSISGATEEVMFETLAREMPDATMGEVRAATRLYMSLIDANDDEPESERK